jgi:hypothetical protein
MNSAIRGIVRCRRAAIRGACVVVCTGVSATLTPAGIAVADPPQDAVGLRRTTVPSLFIHAKVNTDRAQERR